MKIKEVSAFCWPTLVWRKKIITIVAVAVLMVVPTFVALKNFHQSLAAPGTTYLGGVEDGGDLLRLAITNDGGVNLQRYNSAGNCGLTPGATGSCWTKQYFAGNGSGLVFYANGQVMFWGGNSEANFESKSSNVNISVGNSVVASGVESIVRTWTGVGPASGIVLNETISLAKSSLEYTRTVEVVNNTGAALSDVRLIVGGDTQYMDSDNGYVMHGTRNGGNAVYTYTNSASDKMIFSGTSTTPADRYFAGNFNVGRIYAKVDAWLTNEASGASELIDTGYYLQWGNGARNISAGGTWLVGMSEELTGGVLYGDVNNDASVDAADITLVRRHVAGWPVAINLTAADVNVDTYTDAADVTLTRRHVAGWPVVLGAQSSPIVLDSDGTMPLGGRLTIAAGNVSGNPGDVVEVPIVISDNGLGGKGIGAISGLELRFDDSRLEWAGTATQSIIGGGMLDFAVPQGANFSSSHARVSFDSEDGTKLNGTLVTFRVKIKDGTPAGDVPLTLTVDRVNDDSLMVVLIPSSEYDIVGGKIAVLPQSSKPVPTASQIDFVVPTSVTYNASAQPISAPVAAPGVVGLGAITVRYAGTGGTIFAESTTAPANAGSYTVYADIAEGAEYSAAKLSLGTYTIAKKSISISGGTIVPKTYDGTTAASVSAVAFSGLEGGQSLTMATDYTVNSAAFNSADAGTNKTVTATVVIVANSKTGNYTLSSGALSVGSQTIAKAAATGVNQEFGAKSNIANTYTFDLRTLLPGGVPASAISSYSIESTVGSIYTMSPSISGYEIVLPIASTTAGNAKSVITIGFVSNNYNVSSANITINITDRTPVAISGVSVASRAYNGSPIAMSGAPVFTDTILHTTVSTLIPVYTWKTDAGVVLGSAPVDAGSYKLVVSADGGANYNVADLEIGFSINKANQNITFVCPASGYVGDTIALSASISTGLSGIVFQSQSSTLATVSGNTLSLVAAGTAIIEASHPGSANYNSTSSTCNILITLGLSPAYNVIQHFADFDGVGHRVAIVDIDLSEFVKLTFNGADVHPDHHAVTSGSTVITLNSAFLATLPAGTHTFLAEFNGGVTVPLSIVVLAGVEVPRTGLFGLIAGDGYLSVGFALLAVAVSSVTIIKRKGLLRRAKIRL